MPRSRLLVIGSNGVDNIGAAVVGMMGGHPEARVDQFDYDGVHNIQWDEYTDMILCNGMTHLDWIEDQPDGAIEQVIQNTLTSTITYTMEFVKATIFDHWRKRIIYVGSMAHNKVLNASAPYCAAKAGVAHFARCMAWELTPKGYIISTVHPGNVKGTPMTEETIKGIMRYRRLNREMAEDYWSAACNSGEFLEARDVALVLIGCLAARPNQSGQQIELSGGQR